MPEARPRGHVIAIVGPTAVGKSTVAEVIAARLGGEIVSADSMQMYRGMDVGTAKVPVAERTVPYHCVDMVEPGAPYSAALYQRDARSAIDGLLARGRAAIVCGGTGLYVRAALDEMEFPAGEVASPSRNRIESELERLGSAELHAALARRDPASAALIHPNNTRRVVRALEMLEEGVTYAGQAAGFSARRAHYPARYVGLAMDRPTLYARIDARVETMVASGLVDEVERLLAAGYRDALTAAQAIGYKELVPVVEGRAELADAVGEIQRSTRRYAKRQLTWFRADPRIEWLDVTEMSPGRAAEAALSLLESDEGS